MEVNKYKVTTFKYFTVLNKKKNNDNIHEH